MSLSLQYLGTPVYEMAVEIAEEYSDDFDTQEQFIEGALLAYTIVASCESFAEEGSAREGTE